MRTRLQKFLPIVLIALAMQVLAPIAACWAAGLAAADPLQNVAICHSAGPSGDQDGVPGAHAGSCSLCCLAHAAPSFDARQVNFAVPFRHAERVVWHEANASVVAFHGTANAQARGPPHLT